MACPHCEGDNLEILGENYTEGDEDLHVEVYQCLDCGTTFTWESRRYINDLPPEEEDFNKRLEQVKEWLRKQKEQKKQFDEYIEEWESEND